MDQQDSSFARDTGNLPLDHIPEQIPEPPIDPVQTARKRIAGTLLSLLFILVVSEIVVSFLAFVLQFRNAEILKLPGAAILLSSLPTYYFAMPLSLLLFRLIPEEVPEKKKIAFPSFLGFLCIALLLTFAGGILGNIINSIIGSIIGSVPENSLDTVADATPIWMQFIFFVVLAPIFEEIFYRKLLYDRLSVFGELPAILICGIIFGLIHGNFYQFFYAAAAGILFTFVYAKTGKILYTIGLHALLNFSGTILTEWINNLDASESKLLSDMALLLSALFAFCVILGLVFAILYWVSKKQKPTFGAGSIPLSPGQWASALFGNPGTWIFLAFILQEFIIPLFRKEF